MICVSCGHDNPTGTNYCERCLVPLPKLDMFQVFEPKLVTDRLLRVQGAVQRVQSGELLVADFAAFISENYETLVQKGLEIQDFINENSYFDDASDEVEVGYEGMRSWEEGLQEIYLYSEDYDLQHLTAGMEQLIHGNNCINEAMRVNRESREQDGVIGTL